MNTLGTSMNNTVDAIIECAHSFAGHLDCVYENLKDALYEGSAVYFAAESDIYQSLDVLIKFGADVNLRMTPTDDTPLMAAAYNGYPRCVKLLIKAGADVDAEIAGSTVLIDSTRHPSENFECTERLLDAGADVNKRSRDGSTALTIAASLGDDKYIQLLIKSGADVNIPNHQGETALISAVKHGRSQHADQFIKAGADVNYQGSKLLLYASEQSSSTILKTLFRPGININEPNILTSYLGSSRGNEKKGIVLLLAAGGETIDKTKVQIPKYLKPRKITHLMHLCREVIREHLLELDPHTNLYGRVPRLGLPSLMTDYLLCDVSLDESLEED